MLASSDRQPGVGRPGSAHTGCRIGGVRPDVPRLRPRRDGDLRLGDRPVAARRGAPGRTEFAVESIPPPDWLKPLPDTEIVGAWQATDPLHDSTDLVLTLRVGQFELSLIVLIDFNADGAVKDAFLVPAPLADVRTALTAEGRAGLDSARPHTGRREGLAERRCRRRSADRSRSSPTTGRRFGHCWNGPSGAARRAGRAGISDWPAAEIAELVTEFAATPDGAVVAVRLTARSSSTPCPCSAARRTGIAAAQRRHPGDGTRGTVSPMVHHELGPTARPAGGLAPFVRWTHGRSASPPTTPTQALAVLAHRRAEFSRDVTLAHEVDSI